MSCKNTPPSKRRPISQCATIISTYGKYFCLNNLAGRAFGLCNIRQFCLDNMATLKLLKSLKTNLPFFLDNPICSHPTSWILEWSSLCPPPDLFQQLVKSLSNLVREKKNSHSVSGNYLESSFQENFYLQELCFPVCNPSPSLVNKWVKCNTPWSSHNSR